MNINLRDDELRAEVIAALASSKPLSLLRIGDGEMIVLNPLGAVPQETINRFTHGQIGRYLDDQELSAARQGLMDAILGADILGLPSAKHIRLNEWWASTIPFFQELRAKQPESWRCQKFVSIDCHRHLLEGGALYEIIAAATRVTLVTCRDIRGRFVERFPHLQVVEQLLVPGEMKYEPSPPAGEDILAAIGRIEALLQAKERAGHLLLLGAGFLGKRLGRTHALMGGVSLDIGSVFDLWAGKNTRAPGKGPTSYIKPCL